MSTRITNRLLLAALLCVSASLPARAAKPQKKADAAADKGDKDDKDDKDAPDADEPEAKLPPILLKALHEKEAEVTAARREAIKLIESYLHDSPHSREQAEAMYKLAELYWEESKAVYLEKMGRYPPDMFAQLQLEGLMGDDEEYWPFEGEYWSDEYENYK